MRLRKLDLSASRSLIVGDRVCPLSALNDYDCSAGPIEASVLEPDGTIQRDLRERNCTKYSISPAGSERFWALMAKVCHAAKVDVDCLKLDKTEGPFLLRYEKGQFFARHRDDIAGRRKVTFILFVEASDDLMGGQLSVSASDTFAVDIDPLRGRCCIMDAWIPHEVKPVVRGQRGSLIGWTL